MKRSIVLLVGCLFSILPAIAQTQTVTIKTSKAIGETMTLVVNDGSGVSVDWGNGAVKATTDTIVGTVAAQSVVITGSKYWYWLDCSENKITEIDLVQAQALTNLYCQNNELTNLRLLDNPNLEVLNCSNNLLSALPLSSSLNMIYLNCSNNQLVRLTLTKATKMETCICANNQISTLTNLANCTDLKTLWCQGNQLTELRLGLMPLASLMCYDNKIKNIIVTNEKTFSGIETLICDNNKIPELDLSNCDELVNLSCDNNGLTDITLPKIVSTAHKLYLYSCANNKMGFNDLPSNRSVINMLYSPQDEVVLPASVKIKTETVDLSKELKSYTGASVAKVEWYKADGTPLVINTDYEMEEGITTFLKEFPSVYSLIKSATYPDLTLKSTAMAVFDPLGIDGVEKNETGFTCIPQNGGILVSAATKTKVSVCSINGSNVWNGTVGTDKQFIPLIKGIYAVNHVTVLVK
ncbi:MAG: hypothetical protein RRY07_03560 [Bacteroidaceae bacterium]